MSTRVGHWLGVWSLAAAMAACGGGGGGGGGGDEPATTPGVATIGVAGGTVVGEDGAQISFPARALASAMTVRIAKDSTGAPPLPAVAAPAGAVFAVTPHGGDFAAHAEVSIPVERRAVADNEQLLLVTAEPGQTQWRVLSGATYINGVLRAPVMRFSFFRAIIVTDLVVPQLVTTIAGMNNVGGTGVGLIAPDHEFTTHVGQQTPNQPARMRLEARLSFPAQPSLASLATRPATASARTSCLPVSYGHSGADWRFLRNGAEFVAPSTAHLPFLRLAENLYPRFVSESDISWEFFRSDYLAGFGAAHFYGQDVPRRGEYGVSAVNPLDVWALPPTGNSVDNDLLTWRGSTTFVAEQHNGRMRVDVTVPTTCGLFIEAVPLAFRLNLTSDTNDYFGVYPAGGPAEAAEGSPVVLDFLEELNPGSASIRWEYSNGLGNWQGLPVPSAWVTGPHNVRAGGRDLNGHWITIANVQQSQAGYYRAVACARNNPTLCRTGTRQLIVRSEIATITGQPAGQTVQVGETASFTVTTGGIPAPTLQWQKRSLLAAAFGFTAWTNIDGATAPSYTTPINTLADTATQFRVWARNSLGGVASDIAMLTVVEQSAPPVVQAQPGNLNVTVGGTAVFAATVSGSGPLSYQWRRNGVNITGANSAILTLANVSALDDGRYDLVVSNGAGSATSEQAALVVTLATPAALAPTIAAPPASITVAAGNAANFAVAVNGTGPYTYLWMKNGVQASIPNGNGPSFGIASATAADAGSYTVRVTNSVGTVVSTAATLTVTPGPSAPPAPTPPAITTPPIALAALPGAAATFAVAVTGTAPFSYQWRRNGADIPGATGAVLHFAAVTALDAGQYAVDVRNAAGVASSPAALLIVVGAPAITQQPAAVTVTEGGTALFRVGATGDGLRYQWTRNQVAIAGATSASYSTPTLALADIGAVYGVIVYNGAGLIFSQGAVLTVNPAAVAPVFTTQPASQSVVAPASATFTVAVTSATVPTLQWQMSSDGGSNWADVPAFSSSFTPGAASSTYITPATSVADSGKRYRVVVGNAAGTENSNVATLTVAGAAGRAWQTAALIEANNLGDATRPQIGFDAAGNALAVWQQWDGTAVSIWANRYTAATNTWGTAALIETDNAGNAAAPQIAVDASGNAFAVWHQDDGTSRYNIWANRYTAATGTWGTAALIETNAATAPSGPQIAIDGSGNALAVWNHYGGGIGSVWANRYSAGTGWGTATRIETGATNSAGPPQIAIDANGNALAVWNRFDGGSRNDIWANRYTAATNSWGTAALIETGNAGTAESPQVAVDANGNGVAVWAYFDGARYDIVATHYTAATNTWGPAALSLTASAGSGGGVQIGFDATGNAIAVWAQEDGTRYNIWAKRYTAGTGWGTAALIESDNAGNADQPQLAFDDSGNAIVVWYQSDGTRFNVWANRYTAGSGWGAAALLETDNAGNALRPQIAVDGNGNAIAVWDQSDGSRINIRASSYR